MKLIHEATVKQMGDCWVVVCRASHPWWEAYPTLGHPTCFRTEREAAKELQFVLAEYLSY